jgi:hypothetical protein
MNERRWERHAPLAGVLAVALWLIGILIVEGVGNPPNDDVTGQEAVAYYDDDSNSILAGSLIWALGTLAFIWFLGSLRSALHRAEGGVGRVASIAFAAGIAVAIFSLCLFAPDLAGAITMGVEDTTLEGAAAQALHSLGDGFFVLAEYTAALLLAATALVALRTGILPRWLAWVSLLIAVVLLIPPIGWAGLIFAFPLWIIAVSYLLWREPALDEAEVRPAT